MRGSCGAAFIIAEGHVKINAVGRGICGKLRKLHHFLNHARGAIRLEEAPVRIPLSRTALNFRKNKMTQRIIFS